mmetsp:Transcript_118604/g.343005  ORF Transcript_118604/g.343005 Transcript_118604/m.343005 type:complete len:268 (+) Transcript_118604:2174-2977(+)
MRDVAGNAADVRASQRLRPAARRRAEGAARLPRLAMSAEGRQVERQDGGGAHPEDARGGGAEEGARGREAGRAGEGAGLGGDAEADGARAGEGPRGGPRPNRGGTAYASEWPRTGAEGTALREAGRPVGGRARQVEKREHEVAGRARVAPGCAGGRHLGGGAAAVGEDAPGDARVAEDQRQVARSVGSGSGSARLQPHRSRGGAIAAGSPGVAPRQGPFGSGSCHGQERRGVRRPLRRGRGAPRGVLEPPPREARRRVTTRAAVGAA